MEKKGATAGQRIRAIRGEKMSQAEFGQLLDSSQGAVSAWERDDTERSPSAAIYFRLAALAQDPEDSIFFLKQAGLQPDSVISVAALLAKGGVKMDAILPAAEQLLKERMGEQKQLEDEGKVVLVPPFAEGVWATQQSLLRRTVDADKVTNKASTFYIVAPLPPVHGSTGHDVIPGETIFFDSFEASTQRFFPFWHQVVLINPPNGKDLLIGRVTLLESAQGWHLVLGPADLPEHSWRLDGAHILATLDPERYADKAKSPRHLHPHLERHYQLIQEWNRELQAATGRAASALTFPHHSRVLGRVISRIVPDPIKEWKRHFPFTLPAQQQQG
jgi:transcriptional regulator with XRE-family HTH domain